MKSVRSENAVPIKLKTTSQYKVTKGVNLCENFIEDRLGSVRPARCVKSFNGINSTLPLDRVMNGARIVGEVKGTPDSHKQPITVPLQKGFNSSK